MITLAIYYTLADIVLLVQCFIYDRKPAGAGATTIDPKHLSPANPLLDDSVFEGDDGEEEAFTETQPLLISSSSNNSPAGAVVTRKKSKKVSKLRSFVFNLLIVFGVFLTGFLGWYFSADPDNDDGKGRNDEDLRVDLLGQIFGYLCAVLYLGSRLPQILLNFERKSCDGISFLFFLFACLGNLTYVISILALGVTPRYLLVNASWLAGSVGTLILDGIIFTQFWVYNGMGEEESDSECESESDSDSVGHYQAV
ncbi:hypothetical protein D0Z00_003540 [Geotrichum galactomycetum]|uniref:Uncharacterized protein n=1 Tax=Geotrichum galactomycetum TaxID=27317 RepID=A0ACB6V146_9ASCO|nr:hypothetical protein D0Z00_003540 [Geotrichum candidum]